MVVYPICVTSADPLEPSVPRVEALVRRYYAVVADLGSSADQLRELLADDLRVTEHPNLVSPRGAVRDLDATLAGFEAGKALLAAQRFDVHEVIVSSERVAVRATWSGTIGVDAGHFRAGQELIAHVASLLTVRGGRIAEHETYDCYEPLPTDQ